MGVFKTAVEVLEHLSVKTGNPVMMLSGAEEKLRSICNILDDMISEFDAETYTVTVEPNSLALEIDVVVPEMIVENCCEHDFFKLVELSDSFAFSVEDENIVLSVSAKGLFCIAK